MVTSSTAAAAVAARSTLVWKQCAAGRRWSAAFATAPTWRRRARCLLPRLEGVLLLLLELLLLLALLPLQRGLPVLLLFVVPAVALARSLTAYENQIEDPMGGHVKSSGGPSLHLLSAMYYLSSSIVSLCEVFKAFPYDPCIRAYMPQCVCHSGFRLFVFHVFLLSFVVDICIIALQFLIYFCFRGARCVASSQGSRFHI